MYLENISYICKKISPEGLLFFAPEKVYADFFLSTK